MAARCSLSTAWPRPRRRSSAEAEEAVSALLADKENVLELVTTRERGRPVHAPALRNAPSQAAGKGVHPNPPVAARDKELGTRPALQETEYNSTAVSPQDVVPASPQDGGKSEQKPGSVCCEPAPLRRHIPADQRPAEPASPAATRAATCRSRERNARASRPQNTHSECTERVTDRRCVFVAHADAPGSKAKCGDAFDAHASDTSGGRGLESSMQDLCLAGTLDSEGAARLQQASAQPPVLSAREQRKLSAAVDLIERQSKRRDAQLARSKRRQAVDLTQSVFLAWSKWAAAAKEVSPTCKSATAVSCGGVSERGDSSRSATNDGIGGSTVRREAIARATAALETLRGRARSRRAQTRGSNAASRVLRSSIVATGLQLLAVNPTAPDIPLTVTYEGEFALDSGGCMAEFLGEFLASAVDPSAGLFETCLGPLEPVGTEQPTVVPSRHAARDALELVGAALARALVQGVPAPVASLAPSVFSYLATSGEEAPGSTVTMAEVAAFDPVAAGSLFAILRASPATLASMHLPLRLSHGGEGSSDESDGPSPPHVTVADRRDFVHRKMQQTLFGGASESRVPALAALRRGFRAHTPLAAALEGLSGRELEDLLCGDTPLTTDLRPLLHFSTTRANAPSDAVKAMLLDTVGAFSGEESARFLRFCCGLRAVPPGGLHNRSAAVAGRINITRCACRACLPSTKTSARAPSQKRGGGQSVPDVPAHPPSASASAAGAAIGARCTRLPVASTCFWTLRVPTCASAKDMHDRFVRAFEWGGNSFGEL